MSSSAGTTGDLIDVSLLKEGDIIFQETRSEQATVIRLATHSRYTHAGIIFKYGGSFKVLEAVQPVRITSLSDFINRGVDHHYVIKRLANHERLLTPQALTRMKSIGASFLGRDYDLYFEWSDRRLYCTELIWKIYQQALQCSVGTQQRLRDFDLSHPRVRALMKKRYGARIPYDEPVISPEALFRAHNLTTVIEHK